MSRYKDGMNSPAGLTSLLLARSVPSLWLDQRTLRPYAQISSHGFFWLSGVMTQVLSADEMKQCCAFVFCPPGNLALKGLYVTLGKKEKHGTIPGDVRCVHNMMESQTVVTNLLPCWQLNNYVISTKQIKVGKRIGSDHHPIFSKRKKKILINI